MTKFNVPKLRAAVQDALASAEAAHAQRVIEWEAFTENHKADWIDAHGNDWLKALAAIQQSVELGIPITSSLLPGGRNNIQLWSEPYRDDRDRVAPSRNYIASQELLALLATLDLISEDEISQTGLRALGVNGSAMQRAIRMLTAAKVGAS